MGEVGQAYSAEKRSREMSDQEKREMVVRVLCNLDEVVEAVGAKKLEALNVLPSVSIMYSLLFDLKEKVAA